VLPYPRRPAPPPRRPPRAQAEQDAEQTFDRLNPRGRASIDQCSRYVWQSQADHLADSLTKGDRVMVTGRLRQRSWETPEGEKRSVTEIEADEVGASLKWATAKVERTNQRGNGERSSGRERQAERGGDLNDAPPF
jgi:single stranded DNA-binding protein